MAIRKSRRDRRIENEKRTPFVTEQAVSIIPPSGQFNKTNGVKGEDNRGLIHRVDFATEYFYVYHEVRNIMIISVGMFVLMFALSYLI